MEGYPGAVILATNLRQNMDDAFLRRLDFVVDFPFPEPRGSRADLEARASQPPRRSTDDIDVHFLAERFQLSGGSIRNGSLTAAFLAADGSGRSGWTTSSGRVALEYNKLGRLTIEADFEHFHELIRPQTGTFPAVG